MMKKIKTVVAILLVLTGIFILPQTQTTINQYIVPSKEIEQEVQPNIIGEITGELPTDKLVITPERQIYKSGQLSLIIPKLKIEATVMNGTDQESLKKGPGLYEYAQLPGEGNRNVSIAGHRGIYGSVFYYIDKLQQGDVLFLEDDKNRYEYAYHETKIIEPDDWSVIYPNGNSCLTLTTCHPIGESTHRIIVIANLLKITPLEEN